MTDRYFDVRFASYLDLTFRECELRDRLRDETRWFEDAKKAHDDNLAKYPNYVNNFEESVRGLRDDLRMIDEELRRRGIRK